MFLSIELYLILDNSIILDICFKTHVVVWMDKKKKKSLSGLVLFSDVFHVYDKDNYYYYYY